MGKAFELPFEAEVAATPEQVWDAVATGPGIDSWFMGRNDVAAGEIVRMVFGEYAPEHTVTAWKPGKRLAYGGDQASDGRCVAHEFLIEARGTGSTVVRMVTSGFLPGDDWADEYQAMSYGSALFFATLHTYLTHFPGRTATPVTAFGPRIADWDDAWSRLRAAIGRTGDRVRFTPDGLPAIDGTVYLSNAQAIGIRTPDAIYRFVQGLPGSMIAMHHDFAGSGQTEQAWQSWLTTVLG